MRRWPTASTRTATIRPAAVRGTPATGAAPGECLTDNCGPVEIEVPRERNGSFAPANVRKWQRKDVLGLWAGNGGGVDHEVLDEGSVRAEEPRRGRQILRRL